MMKQTIHIILFTCFLTTSAIVFSQQKINDWENPSLVSENAMEPHAWFVPYPSKIAAIKKTASPFIKSLDGIWKFKWVKSPAERSFDFQNDGFDLSNWENIKVPANWQTEGYDKYIFTDVEYPIKPNPPFVPADYNPVGSYKRNFTIPENWKGKDVILRLGAVNSFFYLWINGKYVGLSKDSKTPAEFDITGYIRQGINSVSLQVFRFSDGTYLEGQDMWKLSGIERSVSLIARDKNGVKDFYIHAGLDSAYKNGILQVDVEIKNPTQRRGLIEINLIDDAHPGINIASLKKDISDKLLSFSAAIPSVKKWNAETPNLYTLLITQKDKTGKIVEVISNKIGFRSVEIKQGLMLINGIAIRLKGVNRHEHDMYHAKVITYQSMIDDIKLMKRYNINAVRTSHYPNREDWYELCNEYGLYVIDEANIECDGMDFHPTKTLSDKEEWKAAYLDRTKRMFERDKNFSCIIGWSLGNESRWGNNFIATHDYLKSRDKSRFLQYEEARDNPYTDVIAPMYKSTAIMQDYVKTKHDRPYIQCEYAHMMGNSGGNLKDDWDLMYKHEQLQGGFIWDFSDQTFKKKDLNGRWIWAYGRDMGNVGATSDTSFCADGLFAGDRSPHPQAFEVKKVYQNIYFDSLDFINKKINITNRFDFIDLSYSEIKWSIKSNGKLVCAGVLPTVKINPHETKRISLNIPRFEQVPGEEYFLRFEATQREKSNSIDAGYTIATDQFIIPTITRIDAKKERSYIDIFQKENEEEIIIHNEIFSVSFNKKTGWLQSYKIVGVETIKENMQPHFWRGPTDNDIGNSLQMRAAVWQDAVGNSTLDSIHISSNNRGVIEITTSHFLPSVDAHYITRYQVHGDGTIEVHANMIAGKKTFPELPRFGMRMILQGAFDKTTWYGRGPFDNYIDRNYAADVDLYAMSSDSLFHPYARAQESGYRTDVRWISQTNKNGIGLMVFSDSLLSSGVLHFGMDKLDFDRNSTENNHGGSIQNEDMIWWNIDYKQMGVGGDNSWGAKTHQAYTLPYQGYHYNFTIKPIYKK
jgi:beta-galactosidase